MEKKKITRKVISSKLLPKEVEIPEQEVEETKELTPKFNKTKKCSFCQNKIEPTYTDIVTLRRFVTDRVKIVPKMKSGLCSRHQRLTTRNIKYARHLALLAFSPLV